MALYDGKPSTGPCKHFDVILQVIKVDEISLEDVQSLNICVQNVNKYV